MSAQINSIVVSKIVQVEQEGGITVIKVNNPPVNTITEEVRDGLRQALHAIPTSAKAIVVMCEGKTFFSGADMTEFSGPPKEGEYRTLFSAYENLPMPVIAAMHGTVMGGGVELAMACHYRIASRGTRFAMPEVTLGIIPGAGGTQRLPRLVGAEKALDLVLSAKPIDATVAQQIGLIDLVVSGDLKTEAIAFAQKFIADKAAPKRTSERTVDPKTATQQVFDQMRKRAAEQYPNIPAAGVAVEAVEASLLLPFAEGLGYEALRVNQCKETTACKGAVHAFFAERNTRTLPGISKDLVAGKIASAGVIGAGTMGGGIAICFANADIPVVLLDASEEYLQRGMKRIESLYQSQVERGRISANERDKRLALIKGTLAYQDLKEVDIVIEAVIEDTQLKRTVLATLDSVCKSTAIIATNTSTLDINQLAQATQRPQQVIGTHFFSPANVMPLLEVVRASMTSDQTVVTVMELSKRLPKTPVLANVCYGFIGNRMMEGYARESQRLVLEGATPLQVDSALEGFGMAMGILAVFDMAGVDVGVNVHKANADKYPPDPTYYQADAALYEAGRLGQKNGKGYYRYEPGNRSRLEDPEAISILRARAKQLEVPQREHSTEEIVERCLYPLLNVGFRILEERVALKASDIDVVWTAGYGFPRYRGGPIFYAESIGLDVLLNGILKYQDQCGPMHWQPAPLLAELVTRQMTVAEWQAQRL